MPRFVILYHDCPTTHCRSSHWDLMFEAGDVLRTWALERLPRSWHEVQNRTTLRFPNCQPVADDDSVAALKLPDHRRAYLEFAGQISDNRGEVIRVESGTFEGEREGDDGWEITVKASEINGRLL